jgi:quinol monooxygenase YgiN
MSAHIALIVRFRCRPGKKEALRKSICSVIDVMAREADFVNALLHESLDDPDQLVVYEIWKGTRESWLRYQLPRPYRQEYERNVAELLESRTVDWLVPVAEWESTLTR